MSRMRESVRCLGLLMALVLARPVLGQRTTALELPMQDALEATMATVVHLFFEVDSLPSVELPSAKSLLARRPGTTIFNGISTRYGEDRASAMELTSRIVDELRVLGLDARALPRQQTRQYCWPANATRCALPDYVSLVVLIGYPPRRGALVVTRITLIADSQLRAGRPVVSLDVMVEKSDGQWRVASLVGQQALVIERVI